MIRDLEVLLLTIVDAASREYMQEAVKCYNASAYRAAVVLSVAAGMDGLRKQLGELANSGSTSADITHAFSEIDRKFKDQDVYERQLIEACVKHASLLTPSEAKKLSITLDVRNSCAHPSGHRGTAEEARDAIATIIDFVLSRQALLGTAGISIIMERMEGANFFPDFRNMDQNKAIVEQELKSLHPDILSSLVGRLVGELRTLVKQISIGAVPLNGKQRRKNMVIFLASLTQITQVSRETTWKSLGRLIEQETTAEDALFILRTDPEGIQLTAPLARARAVSIVRTNLLNKQARLTAHLLREKNVLETDEIRDIILSATGDLLHSGEAPEQTLAFVSEIGWPEIYEAFFQDLINSCGDHIFAVANPAILAVQNLGDIDAQKIRPESQVQYILNVAENAGRSNSANQAESLIKNGLGKRSFFLDSLASALETSAPTLLEINTEWKEVARLCISSARPDLLPKLCELFDPAEKNSDKAIPMFDLLKRYSDSSIAQQASEKYDQIIKRVFGVFEDDS